MCIFKEKENDVPYLSVYPERSRRGIEEIAISSEIYRPC